MAEPAPHPLPLIAARVRLRRFRRDDLERFQAYRLDPEVGRYQGWKPTSDEAARVFLDEMAAAPFGYVGEWLQIAVADAGNAQRLGMAFDAEEEAELRGEPCREWRFGLALDVGAPCPSSRRHRGSSSSRSGWRPSGRWRQRARFARLLLDGSGRPYPLEVTVLAARALRRWRHPCVFEAHFSEAHRLALVACLAAGADPRCTQARTDRDLAVQIETARTRGMAVSGPPPAALLPAIPVQDVRDAVLADVDYIERRSTQIYGVLNLCRMLAFVEGRGLCSKAEGGRWALDRVPAAQRATVRRALDAYAGRGADPSAEDVRSFVCAVTPNVRAALERSARAGFA